MPLTGLITSDAIRFSLLVGPVYARRRPDRRPAVRPRQRNPVPRHLLRLDRGRRRHRPAGAGWRAAVSLRARAVSRVRWDDGFTRHHQIAIGIAIALDALAGRNRQAGAKTSVPPPRRCETRRSRRRDRRRRADRPAIAHRICARQIPPAASSDRRWRDRLPARSRSSPAPAAGVGRCHSGNTGVMPVPASFCFAIGADVREEQIAEDHVGDAVATALATASPMRAS